MKKHPLFVYFILVTLISGGFIISMRLMGNKGYYLAGIYMFTPAIAAIITRLFFYNARFKDAYLRFGKWRDYLHFLHFWLIALAVIVVIYVLYTFTHAVSWDFSGETFLSQLKDQMALTGKNINDLPAGLTPKRMLLIFFVGGLTIFNIPTILQGFGEEFGWRGFMFPQLYRIRPWVGFVAGGLIWFLWHVPLIFIFPQMTVFTLWEQIINITMLAVGSICAFILFAYVYVKSESIWVTSFVHIAFNNGVRSISYFTVLKNELLATVVLSLTMVGLVVILYFTNRFEEFRRFFSKQAESSLGLSD